MVEPARHGTPSGHKAHQRKGERPCDACYRAKQEYDVRWRAAPERTRKQRRHAKAQMMALSTLKRRYPDEYRTLYEDAVATVEREAVEFPVRG